MLCAEKGEKTLLVGCSGTLHNMPAFQTFYQGARGKIYFLITENQVCPILFLKEAPRNRNLYLTEDWYSIVFYSVALFAIEF